MQKTLSAFLLFLPALSLGQIPLSQGAYSQNFNSLAASGSTSWTDNSILPGWYAARSTAPNEFTSYSAGAGTTTVGALYSFGAPGSTERALGSLASGGTGRIAYGLRFTNDTDQACSDFAVSYSGEQWRVADSNLQMLRFAFRIGTNLASADAVNDQDWTPQPALDFVSPQTGATQSLIGNDPTNRRTFDAVQLTGVVVPPGKEIFLRWLDENDSGYDDALAIDDVEVMFNSMECASPGLPSRDTISLLTYNTHGNDVEDWSTNSYQVRAIGRQLAYLNPDLITLNEIPETNTWQMENWVKAFLPGYSLATNSMGDGSIRSVVLSRFPVSRSQSRLHGRDLALFGCTNSFFKRDLFEAEVVVPGFARPLHVFIVHLKSSQDAASSLERGAEAAAVSNFFAVDFPAQFPCDPYTLSGDLNEDIARPPASFPQSVSKLANAATGLHLTSPLDPVTRNELTFSIQNSNLSKRYDYILPCSLLYSNLAGDFVFRTDEHPEAYPLLHTNDSRNASDHLPVYAVFYNPYTRPFRMFSIARSPQVWTVGWESIPGLSYAPETSWDLITWSPVSPSILATDDVTRVEVNAAQARFVRVRRLP